MKFASVFPILFLIATTFFETPFEPSESVAATAPPSQAPAAPTIVETAFGRVVAQIATTPEVPGDLAPFVLTVAIKKPIELRLAPNDVEGDYGDFDVAPRDDSNEASRDAPTRDAVVRSWTLYPKRRGTLVLPPIPLQLSTSSKTPSAPDADGETSPIFLVLPEQTFVVSPSNAAPAALESIAPDLTQIRRFPTSTVAISALALAALLGIAFAVWRRSRRRPLLAASAEPTEAPSTRALRLLDELKESRLYLENALDFYPAVSAILRRYLEEEFGVSAGEKTTQEVARELEIGDARLLNGGAFANDDEKRKIAAAVLKTPEIRRDVERSLSAVDLVKFARRAPTFDDARQIFETTRRAVETASRLLALAFDKLAQTRAAERADADGKTQ